MFVYMLHTCTHTYIHVPYVCMYVCIALTQMEETAGAATGQSVNALSFSLLQ
jgi:hypothetical protein